MSKTLGMWVVVLAIVAAPTLAYAAMDKMMPQGPWASQMGWANQAKGKLVYGLKNTLLGWTEIFTEPKDALDEGGNFFVGVGKGLWNAVGQTVGGVVDLATFPIPQISVPLPEGGTKVL